MLKMENNYWAERSAAAAQRLTDLGIAATNKQLIKYYSYCQKKIIREFESLYNELMAKKAADEELTPADLYRLDKYWELQGQLTQELTKLGDRSAAILSKNFIEQYINTYNIVSLKGEATFATIDLDAAAQMVNSVWCADGKNWSQRLWTNTAKLQDTLNEQLVHCVITGKNTTQMKNLLQTEFTVNYNQADRLVRTEMSHIQNAAARQRYKDYGIKEYKVLADNCCSKCEHLKHEKYSIDEIPPVPFHPRCRCCIIPIVDI